jgi:hypothetical protein
LEGVKQLTGEKRWVELRVLKKWWRRYAKQEEEVLTKALGELKGGHMVASKRDDRMWKLAHREGKGKGQSKGKSTSKGAVKKG